MDPEVSLAQVRSYSENYTQISISTHKNSSVFFAELYGVLSTRRWIFLNSHRKNVVVINSLSVLQTFRDQNMK